MGINTAQPSTSPAKIAKADKPVGKPESSGVFTRAIFKDKCESGDGDSTFIPKSTVCFAFILVCCILYPVLTLLLTAVKYRNSPEQKRNENKTRLLISIGLQILIPIISGLIMYGAYDTCNALYAYAIGVVICTCSWFLHVFWLLSNLNSAW